MLLSVQLGQTAEQVGRAENPDAGPLGIHDRRHRDVVFGKHAGYVLQLGRFRHRDHVSIHDVGYLKRLQPIHGEIHVPSHCVSDSSSPHVPELTHLLTKQLTRQTRANQIFATNRGVLRRNGRKACEREAGTATLGVCEFAHSWGLCPLDVQGLTRSFPEREFYMASPRNIELLVVDDDHDYCSLVAQHLMRAGFRVHQAGDAQQAVATAEHRELDVVVCDMVLPDLSGLELLAKLKHEHPDCEVILVTGQATVETAVKAMKLGAYDYVTKPVPFKELEVLIEKANERRKLQKENRQLRAMLQRSELQQEMVGQSAPMQEMFRLIERAGPSDKAILIQGESGTGKELVARALHRCSRRSAQPIVVINCAALPESLLESELFGHEKGAFTGAVAAKPGLFEVADGGTLFIDEIGELPGSLQAKLLRVLEDGSLRRIGSVKERRVDVRLLAATNRNIAEEVRAGNFREDLYYRINVMSLELPPLRDRRDDIPLLVSHFLGTGWDLEEEALAAMMRYDWPGNIRQLINALERAKILSDDQVVHYGDLPREVQGGQDQREPALAVAASDNLSSMERAKIVEVLRREGGNKSRAARVLGIDRRKLYRLVEKYQIES